MFVNMTQLVATSRVHRRDECHTGSSWTCLAGELVMSLLLMLECGCGFQIWDVQSSCTVRGSHLCLAAEIMELKIKIKNGLVRAKCKELSRCPTLKANCEISCFVYILSLMYIYLFTLTLRLWVALNTSFLYALTDGDVTGTQDGFLCDWYKNHVVTSHSFYK